MSIQVSLVYENGSGVRGSLNYGFPTKPEGKYALQIGYSGSSWQRPPQSLNEAREQAMSGHGYALSLNEAELLALKGALVGKKCPYARTEGSSFARGSILSEEMVGEIAQNLFVLKEGGWDWTQRIDPIRWMVLNRLQAEYHKKMSNPTYSGQDILIKILPASEKVEECVIEVSSEIALELAHYLTMAAHRALPSHLVEIASMEEEVGEGLP